VSIRPFVGEPGRLSCISGDAMSTRFLVTRVSLVLSALGVLCVGTIAAAQSKERVSPVTVTFSDPSRPGTLRIHLPKGGVTVRGTSRSDVLIEAQPSEERSARGRRGRGRGATGSFVGRGRGRGRGANDRARERSSVIVDENNNEIVLAPTMNLATDLEIQVPAKTHLTLSVDDGAVAVEDVDGEIEVNAQTDSITLTNVGGSVVASAHNGKVRVLMNRLSAGKPMAFTTFNGDVDVILPPSAKARLKMRSDQGEIITDFDLPTRQSSATASQSASVQGAANGGGPEFEFRTFKGNIYVRKGTK
jgi:Putative adhesin